MNESERPDLKIVTSSPLSDEETSQGDSKGKELQFGHVISTKDGLVRAKSTLELRKALIKAIQEAPLPTEFEGDEEKE